jgi:hypothetical protein
VIKVGDKVAPFDQMNLTGVVVDLIQDKVIMWMVGGTSSPSFSVVVKLDKDESLMKFSAGQLMRLE